MSPDFELSQLRSFQEALKPIASTPCAFAPVLSAFEPAGGPVSGDFHDVIQLQDGRQVVLLGDVTGHGMSSALVMAVSHGAIREAFRWTTAPCAVMNNLHERLSELGQRAGGPRLFSATLFIAVVEEDGRLLYVNAGHPGPLLLRGGRVEESLRVLVPPLGFVAPEACHSVELKLQAGDRLLLHSDGLVASDAAPDAVRNRVEQLAGRNSSELMDELIGESPAADDRTVAILEYRGKHSSR